MRKSMNYSQLWRIEQDIIQFKNDYRGMAELFLDKIERFSSRNSSRLHMLHTKMQALQKQYCVMVEDGHIPAMIEVDGKLELQYLPDAKNSQGATVIGDGVRDAYLQESGEFLAISFDVEW